MISGPVNPQSGLVPFTLPDGSVKELPPEVAAALGAPPPPPVEPIPQAPEAAPPPMAAIPPAVEAPPEAVTPPAPEPAQPGPGLVGAAPAQPQTPAEEPPPALLPPPVAGKPATRDKVEGDNQNALYAQYAAQEKQDLLNADIAKRQADEAAAIGNFELERRKAQVAQEQAYRDSFQREMDTIQNIDTGRAFHNFSAVDKGINILGGAIAGMLAVNQGSSRNSWIEMMNGFIDRDIQAQEADRRVQMQKMGVKKDLMNERIQSERSILEGEVNYERAKRASALSKEFYARGLTAKSDINKANFMAAAATAQQVSMEAREKAFLTKQQMASEMALRRSQAASNYADAAYKLAQKDALGQPKPMSPQDEIAFAKLHRRLTDPATGKTFQIDPKMRGQMDDTLYNQTTNKIQDYRSLGGVLKELVLLQDEGKSLVGSALADWKIRADERRQQLQTTLANAKEKMRKYTGSGAAQSVQEIENIEAMLGTPDNLLKAGLRPKATKLLELVGREEQGAIDLYNFKDIDTGEKWSSKGFYTVPPEYKPAKFIPEKVKTDLSTLDLSSPATGASTVEGAIAQAQALSSPDYLIKNLTPDDYVKTHKVIWDASQQALRSNNPQIQEAGKQLGEYAQRVETAALLAVNRKLVDSQDLAATTMGKLVGANTKSDNPYLSKEAKNSLLNKPELADIAYRNIMKYKEKTAYKNVDPGLPPGYEGNK